MNDLEDNIAQARQQGWTVEKRASNHLMFRLTD